MAPQQPTGFSIRVAGLADEPAVSELLEVSYRALLAPAYDPAAMRTALPVLTRANRDLLGSGRFHLAETGGRLLVGCGGWSPERPGSGEIEAGLGHIRHFAVHPHWLRRGVGRSLVAICEQEARAAGLRELECFASLNAEAFYAALGFIPLRRHDLAMGSSTTLPSIVMRRAF